VIGLSTRSETTPQSIIDTALLAKGSQSSASCALDCEITAVGTTPYKSVSEAIQDMANAQRNDIDLKLVISALESYKNEPSKDVISAWPSLCKSLWVQRDRLDSALCHKACK